MSTTELGLCTRCQKPLGHIAKKVDGKLYHEECWLEMHREQDPINKLRADRDRLLAACNGLLGYLETIGCNEEDIRYVAAIEAIRLAEKEE